MQPREHRPRLSFAFAVFVSVPAVRGHRTLAPRDVTTWHSRGPLEREQPCERREYGDPALPIRKTTRSRALPARGRDVADQADWRGWQTTRPTTGRCGVAPSA